MKTFLALLGTAATVAIASPASAATCQFNLVGTVLEPGTYFGKPLLADFQLDCNPTPTRVVTTGAARFDIDGVTGIFNGPGVSGPTGTGTGPIALGDLQFYNTAAGGGFEVNDPAQGGFGLFSLVGATLFDDNLNNPTFLTGTYTFTNDFFFDSVAATLTITQLPAAVPEPATWAMLMMGFGGMGYAMRRRSAGSRIRFA